MAYIELSNELIRNDHINVLKILEDYFESMILVGETTINTTIYEVQKEGLPKEAKEVEGIFQKDGNLVKVIKCEPVDLMRQSKTMTKVTKDIYDALDKLEQAELKNMAYHKQREQSKKWQ